MKYCFLILTICFATPGFAKPNETPGPKQEAKQKMREGVRLFQKKKYPEAILRFSRVLEILPEAAGPHRELGKCFQKLGDVDKAIDHFTKFLARKPNDKQRNIIERLILRSRAKLSKKDRALVSITSLPGAVVYAQTEAGENRGIGVSPLEDHPLEPRFTSLLVVLPSQKFQAKITLETSESFTVPEEALVDLAVLEAEKATPVVKKEVFEPIYPALIPSEPSVIKRRSSPISFVFLGASALGLGGSAFLGAQLLQTTKEINQNLLAIEEASFEEKQVLTETLQDLDQNARQQLKFTQFAIGATIVTAATGTALLVFSRKYIEIKEKRVQILPTPQGIQASFSF